MMVAKKESKTMQDIRDLYSQLDHKTNFTIIAGQYFERSPQYLRVHWFGNFWNIPKGFQKPLKRLLMEAVKEQRKNQE